METQTCIYCGRALDVNQLLVRAGQYRCKDENDCLEYQSGDDPAQAVDDADYIAGVAKSSLAEAADRIAAYQRAAADRTQGGAGDSAERSPESTDEWTWITSVLEALALEYKENAKFVFHSDETRPNAYVITFSDADAPVSFTVKVGQPDRSRIAFTVAREGGSADTDPLYNEFIYKSYPEHEKEAVIGDLSVVLAALAADKDPLSAVLGEFRREIESRAPDRNDR